MSPEDIVIELARQGEHEQVARAAAAGRRHRALAGEWMDAHPSAYFMAGLAFLCGASYGVEGVIRVLNWLF